jgi:hypothetical protein
MWTAAQEQAVEVGLDPVEFVVDRLPVPWLRLSRAPPVSL